MCPDKWVCIGSQQSCILYAFITLCTDIAANGTGFAHNTKLAKYKLKGLLTKLFCGALSAHMCTVAAVKRSQPVVTAGSRQILYDSAQQHRH